MQKIYIVEADIDFLQHIENLILRDMTGYKVIGHSYRANELINKIHANQTLLQKIDMLLIDPKLPDMSGLDLIKKIRQMKSDIKICVLLQDGIKTLYLTDIAKLDLNNILIYPASDEYIKNYIMDSFRDRSDDKKDTQVQSFLETTVKTQETFAQDDSDKIKDFAIDIDLDRFNFESINFSDPEPKLKKSEEVQDEENYFDGLLSHMEKNDVKPEEDTPVPAIETNQELSLDAVFDEQDTVNEIEPDASEENDSTSVDFDSLVNESEGLSEGGMLQNQEQEPDEMNTQTQSEFDVDEQDNSENEPEKLPDYEYGKIEKVDDSDFFSKYFTKETESQVGNDSKEEDYEPSFNDDEQNMAYASNEENGENGETEEEHPSEHKAPSYEDLISNVLHNNELLKKDKEQQQEPEEEPETNVDDYFTPKVDREAFFRRPNSLDDIDDSIFDYKKQKTNKIAPPMDFDMEVERKDASDENQKMIENMYEYPTMGHVGRTPPKRKDAKVRDVDVSNIPSFARQIVAFYSTKGGVGKTTSLINTAIMLSKYSPGKRICIVDFDLTNPNVHLQLGIHDTNYDLSDIANFKNSNVDNLLIKKVITKYENEDKSGTPVKFDVIVGFNGDNYLYQKFNDKDVDKILSILTDMYDIVLVDTNPHYAEDAISTILKKATKIVFITQQEMCALDGTSKFINILQKLKLPIEKVLLVVNCYNSTAGIPTSKIEKVLNSKVMSEIPAEYEEMRSAVNENVPFSLSYPDSSIARAYINIAKLIDPTIQVVQAKKGFNPFNRK